MLEDTVTDPAQCSSIDSNTLCLICSLLSPNNNLTFVSLRRRPSSSSSTDSTLAALSEEASDCITEAFSSTFLSDRHVTPNAIHIDYEEYSFALLVPHWPASLLQNYSLDSERSSHRQWPFNNQMDQVTRTPLLLLPSAHPHQWEISFDLVEKHLCALLNESSLLLYILCQQCFSRTYSTRRLIKHSFFTYCEKHGLPLSK